MFDLSRSSAATIALVGALFSIGLLLTPTPSYAFGISPASIHVDNLLRGSKQTRTVRLLKIPDEYDETLIIKAEPTSIDGKSITGPEFVTIPAGQRTAPYTLEIDGSRVANGAYQGAVIFSRAQSSQTQVNGTSTKTSVVNGAAIVSQTVIGIYYTVTGEEQLGYEFRDLFVQDTETILPLYLRYNMLNKGNVSWRPKGFYLSLTDELHPENPINLNISGDALPMVQPGEYSSILVEKTIPLTEGTYTAKMQFYDQNNKTIAELKSNKFAVFPPGTLALKGEMTALSSNKATYVPGENIKISAEFKNTGTIPTHAILITEIYGPENELIQINRTNETVVEKGETVLLNQFTTLEKPNDYTVSGHVEYGVKKTDTKKIAVTVRSPVVTLVGPGLTLWIFFFILILLLLILFYLWYRTTKKSKDIPKQKSPPKKQL